MSTKGMQKTAAARNRRSKPLVSAATKANYNARPASLEEIKALKAGVVFLELTTRGLTMRRKIDAEEIGANEGQAEMLHVGKDLIDQQELKEVRSYGRALKAWIATQCVDGRRLTGHGRYMVPIAAVSEIDEEIQAINADIREVIDDFIDSGRYANLIESAKQRLGKLFKAEEYPSDTALREGFYITRRWMIFDTPTEQLGTVNKEIAEREAKALREAWGFAWEDVRAGLAQGFTELLVRFQKALEPDESGTFRSLKEPLVDQMIYFLDSFNMRNVTNDTELATLIERTRALVTADTSAAALRTTDTVREQVAKAISDIAKDATAITKARGRKLNLPEVSE